MNFLEKFPTAEQVENFNKHVQNTLECYDRNTQARMENYYNCVDDYSWGGICDKAQDAGRSKMLRDQQLLKEQIEKGKPYVRDYESAVLFRDGKQVSDQIINGRFGRAWIIKDENGGAEFVGEAKKQATYIKKGFVVKKRVVKCEYYWTTKTGKNGIQPMARVISDEIQETNDPYNLDSRLEMVPWFALNVYKNQ